MKMTLTNTNVRDLIKAFDLDEPKLYNILIDDFELDNGRIVINSAKVLDDNFNVSRLADQTKLIEFLPKCNIVFACTKEQK